MTVRFALLGAGRIGKVHARAVGSNPQARLVAVADAFEKAATELATAYGAEVRTIDAIEKSKDIDFVFIYQNIEKKVHVVLDKYQFHELVVVVNAYLIVLVN